MLRGKLQYSDSNLLLSNELKIGRKTLLASLLHQTGEPVCFLCALLVLPTESVTYQSVDCSLESLLVTVLRKWPRQRRVREVTLVLLCMLEDCHVICVKLDWDRADDALVPGVNDPEVTAKLVDWVNGFSKILHSDILTGIRPDLFKQGQALVLLQESTILFT